MREVEYKPIVKRMIILSWAFLGICFLFKIFGANIFQVYTSSANDSRGKRSGTCINASSVGLGT